MIVREYEESNRSTKAPKKWWDDMVKKIKKSEPDYSAKQIAATVGKIWSKMSDAKKKTLRGREGKQYGASK